MRAVVLAELLYFGHEALERFGRQIFLLGDLGFDVVRAPDAGRDDMAAAIREFGKRLRAAGPEAVGLFYYAGHGVQANGVNYLIPVDAPIGNEADLETAAVSAQWQCNTMAGTAKVCIRKHG